VESSRRQNTVSPQPFTDDDTKDAQSVVKHTEIAHAMNSMGFKAGNFAGLEPRPAGSDPNKGFDLEAVTVNGK
jgi:hypothetical protein